MCGNAQLVRLLVDNGANVNAAGRKGMKPISMAAMDGNRLIVSALLEVRLGLSTQTSSLCKAR